ncbi:MAG: hypothetical protein K2Q22_15920, partial [Cytophagales bacterium]|nr:hypothetical protein [Cytophagales bacterium]
GFEELIYKSLPSFYCATPSFEEEYALFKAQAERLRVEVNSVVDLRLSSKFAKDRKRMISLAQKHSLRIKEERNVSEFWPQILIPTRWETHKVIPAHALEEMELLMSLFPNNIRQFNIYEKEELIGGGTIFITETVVHTQYIASNAKGKKMGAADILIDYLIRTFKTTHKYLSFGISTDHHGQRLNEGLLYWKNGFGADVFPHYTYRIQW